MLEFIYVLSLGMYLGLSFELYDPDDKPVSTAYKLAWLATAVIPFVNTLSVGYHMYSRRNSPSR